MQELLRSKRICAVAVGYKAEILRKFFEVAESGPHGLNTRADIPVLRDTVSKNGTGHDIHYYPKVAFDTADLDVSLISRHLRRSMIVVVVSKRLYDNSSGPCIVSDLLVRYINALKILESLGSLSERELQINVEGQAQ